MKAASTSLWSVRTAIVALFLVIVLFSPIVLAQPSEHYLEVMSHGAAPPAGNETDIGWSPGHAFFCIGTRTNSGVKEDCYGFFPPGGVRTLVGDNPRRFTNGSVSIRKDITVAQRAAIISKVDSWSGQDNYDLTNHDCIDFAQLAAGAAGWSLPARVPLQTPVQWLTELIALNGEVQRASTQPAPPSNLTVN